jgi:parallel beta-helix repeat protein
MKGLVRVGIAAAFVVGLFSFGAAPAFATTVHCGDVITQDTTLDNDLICDDVGLFVGADTVTVNLNGHTIAGPGSLTGTGIDDRAGYDGITIEKGTIRGFEAPVLLSGADNSVLRDITVANGGEGLFLYNSSHAVIRRVSANDNFTGILLTRGSRGTHVENVSLSGNDLGIVDSHDSDDTLITSSVVSRSKEALELLLSSRIRVERNSFVDNGLAIFPGEVQDSTIAKNRLVRNELGVFVGGTTNLVLAKNIVSKSLIEGITVNETSVGTVLDQNRVEKSGGDGIHVHSPATTITKNTANDNGDLGIDAVEGVIDGGGNEAKGNANPLQCVNVFCK